MQTELLSVEAVFQQILEETKREADSEPQLASFLYSTVLRHKTFADVLAFHLASKMGGTTLDDRSWMELISDAFAADPSIVEAASVDIQAVKNRDPACETFSAPLLFYKGYQALQCFRVANWYWKQGRHCLAQFIQSRVSEFFSVDIHPAARIGKGIFIDHAHGIVIGETAVVEDNVSMLHAVTLGGTGKEKGDRHPKIREGALLSAGAKILGNIEVGRGATVAASSVVLNDVPEHTTVAGIPARIVGKPTSDSPALDMDQMVCRDD